ncbi:MAG: type 1 glutamine amidotransferase [Planctomycetales bacterium]
MPSKVRYLLLQIRDPEDPMRIQEVGSFRRALSAGEDRIGVFDLLTGAPSLNQFARADVILFGGSGDYSATCDEPWLHRTLDVLREVHDRRQPTFASCWGFQAMARALGGTVVHDLGRAEVGSVPLRLTEAGQADPIFAPLGDSFWGQLGHEDSVTELPERAVRLASSERVENQAYCFPDRPIYCTQFHPELNLDDLHERVRAYPKYVERIAGLPAERFHELLRDTQETEALLPRFVRWALDG